MKLDERYDEVMTRYNYDPARKGGGFRTRMPPLSPGLVADMKRYLAGRRLDYGLASYNGWYPSSSAGDDLPRLVIPGTMTSRGPFWQARSLAGGEPRYQSPGGERNGAVIAVRPYTSTALAAVVEGPMDALVAAMYGRIGVAVMGHSPGPATLEAIALAVRPGVHSILFVPDLDSPGAFAVAMGTLASWGFWCTMRLPPRKDLAECQEEERKDLLR